MKCKGCSNELQPNHSFCTQCGAPIEGAKRVNIHQYASILCTDVKGSTALVADLDPEEAYSLLRPVIEKVIEAVEYYGGIVVRTAGDGVIAAFGVPERRGDHALYACLAGLRMQNEVQTMQEKVAIRVGINSGDLVMMPVGSDQHFEYDIAGLVISIASRMEQTGSSDYVRVSSETLKLVDQYFSVSQASLVEVKGVDEKIEGVELLNLKQAHPTEAPESFALFSFMGREEEMNQLQLQLKKVEEGQGAIVGISADLGFGKTRLIDEFLSEITGKCFIWRYQGDSNVKFLKLGAAAIEDLAKENPLIMVIEDVDLLEIETRALLDGLLKDLKESRVLFLLSYSRSYKAPWIEMANYFEWKLPLLSNSDQRLMMDDILGDDFSLELIKQKILNQARGNLFFLEIMVLWLIEHKEIIKKDGNYRVDSASSTEDMVLPESLEAIFLERMTKLSYKKKRTLCAVASFGNHISLDSLAKETVVPVKVALGRLKELTEKCYLSQQALIPEVLITFTHPILEKILRDHFTDFFNSEKK